MINLVWLGNEMLPFAKWCYDRQLAVSGSEVCMHDETVLNGSRFEQFLRYTTCLVQRVDLAVLAALEKNGGWYFDLDVVAIRPISAYEVFIEGLGGDRIATALQQNGREVRCNNNVLYVEKNSCVFDEMVRYLSEGPDLFRIRAHVGPDLFDHLRNKGMTADIPPWAVNPWGTSVSAIEALKCLLHKGEYELREHWKANNKRDPFSFHLWGVKSQRLAELGF